MAKCYKVFLTPRKTKQAGVYFRFPGIFSPNQICEINYKFQVVLQFVTLVTIRVVNVT